MAGLSRDILKWLQSLDLSYSVKNVKRDFANGFLVAEIFSRYFPHDVQMHSFDNGISLPKKLANWELLEKFFLKKRVPIGRDMIDLVIHCKGNAALPLLETIYTCLTSKKVQNMRAKNDDQLIPPFARATASFEIKQNIRDSELQTTLQDENKGKNRTSDLLNEHSQTLRDERLLEPGRFTAVKQQRSSQRVPPRPMQAEVPTGQIEFKEVQVRTLDKQNITHLRASRAVGGDRSATLADADQSSFADQHGGEIAVRSVRSVTAILNPCVDNDMMETLAQLGDELRDPIISMVDALVAKKMDDDEGGKLLGHVKTLVPELVDSFVASPMELWRFLHIFTQLLHMPDQSQCYDQTVDLMCNVGYGMMNRDSYVAAGLFMEYGLPKLIPLFSSRPTKRRRYNFDKNDIKNRKDMQTFLHCIVVLMHLEKDFTEDLVDLYLYYAMVGLGQQSASLRAAAVSMLVLVAQKDEVGGVILVMPVVDKLRALKDDTWWEVSAQLLRLCAAILARNPAAVVQAEQILELVVGILVDLRSPLAKKVAVSALAPLLAVYGNSNGLEEHYMKTLRSLSERDFSVLLALPAGEEHQIMSNTHVMLPLVSPVDSLPPIEVAELLADKITGRTDGAEPDQVAEGGLEADVEKWLGVLKALELHLYVALADDELCNNIVSVLSMWIQGLDSRAFQTFPTLTKSLKLIFGAEPSPEPCQRAALALLMFLREECGSEMREQIDKLVAEANIAKEMLQMLDSAAAQQSATDRQFMFNSQAATEWLQPLVKD